VVGSGAFDAKLVVIGEAPGRSEDEGGEPFIGRSGRLLFELIDSELSLTREQCYVTNVVKCRPPQNRTPRREEIDACSEWLDEQLSLVSAKVILTLGNTATRSVLKSTQKIGELRGVVVRRGRFDVVATFHPAAALRGGPNVVTMMRADLQAVRVLLAESAK
jgi:DNA polymerase